MWMRLPRSCSSTSAFVPVAILMLNNPGLFVEVEQGSAVRTGQLDCEGHDGVQDLRRRRTRVETPQRSLKSLPELVHAACQLG